MKSVATCFIISGIETTLAQLPFEEFSDNEKILHCIIIGLILNDITYMYIIKFFL